MPERCTQCRLEHGPRESQCAAESGFPEDVAECLVFFLRSRIAQLEAQLAAHARAGCPQAKAELEKTKNA